MAAQLPPWLSAPERYVPIPDRGRYLEKSLVALLGALAALRERPGSGHSPEALRPELKLGALLAFVLMVSLSRSPLFIEAAAADALGCLALLRAEPIARTLRKAMAASLFALVIFLPATLRGGSGIALFLSAKVLLSVLAAALFSAVTPWPSISAAFAALRAPGIFVMTLDMAVKYVWLLGGLLLDMLGALKLRSVGRDPRKRDSLSATAGTLFLRSREAAEEQYSAMACRCYAGVYRRARAQRLGPADAAFAGLGLALLAAFAFLGTRP